MTDQRNVINAPYLRQAVSGVRVWEDSLRLQVWAPFCRRIDVEILGEPPQRFPLSVDPHGVHTVQLSREFLGCRYWLVLDNDRRRADPAARYQPEGVLGPSQLIDPDYVWHDLGWRGLPADQLVIYELHVGTFSPAGDFQGVVDRLDALQELGITAIELMPVAQFPGCRNWGYDGVFPYAVQSSYGGPQQLKHLIDACHLRGMAVVLDVVYNHLGPEGNYLSEFGPYFTDRYHTPWGAALNFDGHHSDHVRRYFIQNALYWIEEFHFDGLRLDAIQMIFDQSAQPFLAELAEAVHQQATRCGRIVHLWGETDQNDVRQVLPRHRGGLGLDGLWNDDFHHAVHAALTGERISVYQDHGPLENIARAYDQGFVLDGRYSTHHRRHHGTSSVEAKPDQFVVFVQNHDQIGNRLYGERLTHLVSFESLKLAAALTLLSHNVPMLFMGEEYGERAPFLYFVDHQDAGLRRAVRQGRQRDFRAFKQPGRSVPNPTRESAFEQSRLTEAESWDDSQRQLRRWYGQLIKLRRDLPPLGCLDRTSHDVTFDEEGAWMLSVRRHHGEAVANLFYFGEVAASSTVRWPTGEWTKVLDSAATEWGGPGTTTLDTLSVASATGLTLPLQPRSVTVWRSRDNRPFDPQSKVDHNP